MTDRNLDIMANSSSEITRSLLSPPDQPSVFGSRQFREQEPLFSLELRFACLGMIVLDGLAEPPKGRGR
jgi:hypothetical protein